MTRDVVPLLLKDRPQQGQVPYLSPSPSKDYLEVDAWLERNRQRFEEMLTQAERALHRGALEEGLNAAQVAAHFAWTNHTAEFYSARLEEIVCAIGRTEVFPTDGVALGERALHARRVLHVATEVAQVGGHARLLENWVLQDCNRQHRLLLTQQNTAYPTARIRKAMSMGGSSDPIHVLPRQSGLLERARALREQADRWADMVVLHIHPYDLTPLLAFAQTPRYPVILLNHADHVFWVGASVSTMRCEIRASGRALSQQRRLERPDVLLPIPLSLPSALTPDKRRDTRLEARRLLGLCPDEVLLLSVASGYKYTPTHMYDFLSWHLNMVEKTGVRLWVIGPSPQGQWARAALETGGKVTALGVRTDLAPYFAAADIYLDSSPFASLTSLLEAVGTGLPAISLDLGVYPSPMRADDPALDPLGLSQGAQSYQLRLEQLIASATERDQLGEAMRVAVEQVHSGTGWQDKLETAYATAWEVQTFSEQAKRVGSAKVEEENKVAAQKIQRIGPQSTDRELASLQRLTRESTEACEAQHSGTLPLPTRILRFVKARRTLTPLPLKYLLSNDARFLFMRARDLWRRTQKPIKRGNR